MADKPENPPAFPSRHDKPHPSGACHRDDCPGMSLRDWFAGQALAGFTSCDDGAGDVLMGAADTARAAYNYADAMLQARLSATMTQGEGE